jgi:hypothetical protein
MKVLINTANSLPFFLQSSPSNQEVIPLIRSRILQKKLIIRVSFIDAYQPLSQYSWRIESQSILLEQATTIAATVEPRLEAISDNQKLADLN